MTSSVHERTGAGDLAGRPGPVRRQAPARQPVVQLVGAPHTGQEDVEDAYLVARAREGYPGAFEELVRRHQARAYTVAVRMLGDRGDAQDVTQESLVKAWAHLAGFDERAKFTTWLHRIVVNECVSFLRRRRPVPADPDPEQSSGADTARQVEDLSRDEALRRSVQALPVEQRAALVLTSYLGHSYEEAAVVLAVPASTVRGRVARARRSLLVAMKGWS